MSKQVLMRPEDSGMKLRPAKHGDPEKGIHTFWSVTVIRNDGSEELISDFEHNVFPTDCIDLIHTDMFITTSKSGSGFNFIALTADTTQTINAAQTSLTGEISTNGLTRVQATTRNHTDNSASSLIEHTFTLTGSQADITRAALFNLISGGVMGPFAAFGNGATGPMSSGETVKVSITINTT